MGLLVFQKLIVYFLWGTILVVYSWWKGYKLQGQLGAKSAKWITRHIVISYLFVMNSYPLDIKMLKYPLPFCIETYKLIFHCKNQLGCYSKTLLFCHFKNVSSNDIDLSGRKCSIKSARNLENLSTTLSLEWRRYIREDSAFYITYCLFIIIKWA